MVIESLISFVYFLHFICTFTNVKSYFYGVASIFYVFHQDMMLAFICTFLHFLIKKGQDHLKTNSYYNTLLNITEYFSGLNQSIISSIFFVDITVMISKPQNCFSLFCFILVLYQVTSGRQKWIRDGLQL